MTDKDFDRMLQRVVAEEKLPFEEHSWKAMLRKLDGNKRNDKRVIIFFPIAIKIWASAACVAALLFSGLWYFTKPALPQQSLQVKHNKKQFAPFKEEVIDTSFLSNIATVQDLPANNRNAINIGRKHAGITPVVIESGPVIQQTNTGDTEALVNALPKLPKIYNYELPGVYEIEPDKQDRRINISLNGGIAVQSRSGVSAGFTIRGRLSSKVSVETNVSYIQGQQNIPIKQERTIIVTPPDIGPADTSMQPQLPYSYTESWYKSHRHSLSYLQLAPAVNIKLHKKISSSIGVDMQKILMNKADLDVINKHLASASKKIPEIDPGVVINLNYAITKRISCGIAYRESMVNFTKPKVAYIDRDYVLFQLQYTIVK